MINIYNNIEKEFLENNIYKNTYFLIMLNNSFDVVSYEELTYLFNINQLIYCVSIGTFVEVFTLINILNSLGLQNIHSKKFFRSVSLNLYDKEVLQINGTFNLSSLEIYLRFLDFNTYFKRCISNLGIIDLKVSYNFENIFENITNYKFNEQDNNLILTGNYLRAFVQFLVDKKTPNYIITQQLDVYNKLFPAVYDCSNILLYYLKVNRQGFIFPRNLR